MSNPSSPQRRRIFALGSAVALLGMSLVACSPGPGADGSAAASEACSATVKPEDAKLILGVGDLSSAYWQEVIAGARAVADSVDVELTVYESKFDGQAILNTLTSALAGGGAGTGIIVDPTSNAFTKPIVEAAQQSGARIVTLWNRPTDAHPWDFGGGCWVAHTAFDGVDEGAQGAGNLFNAIGGTGDIVALQGVPDAPSNKQRIYGLHQTLEKNPEVNLLDTQTANWTAANAQSAVNALLSKYPGKIKGIFSANDDMAVGAVEALRSKGLAGKIFVTGSDGSSDMLGLIKKGDALSTVKTDAFGQGAYGAAIAYASIIGDIKPSELTHEQRDFYLKQQVVTRDNVDAALAIGANFRPADYTYDKLKDDLWGSVASPINDDTWIPDVP
ncbi:D-ribose-binding protein [Arthrobacter sp. 9V]|uniref:sugar ABC transporter substrate-binding protein n=1 Tax=Arthrobacter sp. 9V TaxID=2653132 RepID=UPI0012F210AF|nr:sugar ABC transporter substrate-binding protein [Arthrobacter sp. 9V]VXC43491.1 D-ribose-binding protein [Arthrobacter sp. 9V]